MLTRYFHLLTVTAGALLLLSFSPAVDATSASGAEDFYQNLLGQEDAAPASFEELVTRARADGSVNVIVQLALDQVYRPEGELSALELQQQRARIATTGNQVLAALSGQDYVLGYQYESTPALSMRASEGTLLTLRDLQEVGRIVEDALEAPTLEDSTVVIGAPSAWSLGYDGSGMAVVILDTGIDGSHEFFKNANGQSRIISEACFSLAGGAATAVSLCPNGTPQQTGAGAADVNIDACNGGPLCRHGSHVAGIAAGYSAGSRKGVAPNANIIAIQVFSRFDDPDACGSSGAPCVLSYQSDQLAGLERVNNTLRHLHDVTSVNISIGGSREYSACDGDSRAAVIGSLRSANIATAVSSGNNGYTDSVTSPACISSAVAVGNTTKADEISPGSNMSTMVDLMAPGTLINSSVPGGGYAALTGTSMAAPHIAGAWAVLRQIDSLISTDDLLDIVSSTGVPIADTRPGGTVTKPRIDLIEAIADLKGLDTWTVSASAGTYGGVVVPSAPFTVLQGEQASIHVGHYYAYEIGSISSTCGGSLSGGWFTTGPVTQDCNIVVDFNPVPGSRLQTSSSTLHFSVAQGGNDTIALGLENLGDLDLHWDLSKTKAIAIPTSTVPAYSGTGYTAPGYVYLDALNPGDLQVINSSQPKVFYAAEFLDNDLSRHYMLASAPTDPSDYPQHSFGYIDPETGLFTSLGVLTGDLPSGLWFSLSWDHTTKQLYATAGTGDGNHLYQIDPVQLVSAHVGKVDASPVVDSPTPLAIAFSPGGELYAIDIVSDSLLRIDKNTGAALVVGALGYDASFAQDMSFDPRDGTLYWAGYFGSGNSQIMTIDLETGAATPVGNIGSGGAELMSFTTAVANDVVSCMSPTAVSWLNLGQTSGAVAPLATESVSVSVNVPDQMPLGKHHAVLCLQSDDPYQSMMLVPVELEVLLHPNRIFWDLFEQWDD